MNIIKDICVGMEFDGRHEHGHPYGQKRCGQAAGMNMTSYICAGMDPHGWHEHQQPCRHECCEQMASMSMAMTIELCGHSPNARHEHEHEKTVRALAKRQA